MIVETSQLMGHPNNTTWILWKIGTVVKIQAIRKPHQQEIMISIADAALFAPRKTPLIVCEIARRK